MSAQTDPAKGDDNRVETIDPIHRSAFLFHALDTETVGPRQSSLTGANQLRCKTMAPAPRRTLTRQPLHVLDGFLATPDGGESAEPIIIR